MREINLGRVLIENRHKRGITQDELAAYMGVSKAAVSKWETGSTYPDIAVLPQLAMFFNISIDELMGYEPQMAKEEIRKLYQQLSLDFASEPFHEVVGHCREIVKKYYSCFPLLYQIGSLYVNHRILTPSPDEAEGLLEEAIWLFKRVKAETDDVDLAKQALNMEALCLLSLNRPGDVLDLVGEPDFSMTSTEPLLASAYQLLGNRKEAKSILQIGVYQHIVVLMNLMSIYLGLCLDNEGSFEETYQRASLIVETFHVEKLHPSIVLSFYISSAKGYMRLGNREKALDVLKRYTDLATSDIYPLRLMGDQYFNLVDGWLEDTLVTGNDLPRNNTIIRSSISKAVENGKEFLPLVENTRFQNMVKRLKTIEKEEDNLH